MRTIAAVAQATGAAATAAGASATARRKDVSSGGHAARQWKLLRQFERKECGRRWFGVQLIQTFRQIFAVHIARCRLLEKVSVDSSDLSDLSVATAIGNVWRICVGCARDRAKIFDIKKL